MEVHITYVLHLIKWWTWDYFPSFIVNRNEIIQLNCDSFYSIIQYRKRSFINELTCQKLVIEISTEFQIGIFLSFRHSDQNCELITPFYWLWFDIETYTKIWFSRISCSIVPFSETLIHIAAVYNHIFSTDDCKIAIDELSLHDYTATIIRQTIYLFIFHKRSSRCYKYVSFSHISNTASDDDVRCAASLARH